ncbi:MAG: VTT domain-containing protein [Tatlockia sp.]|nr:VTT domain-containing protein [Tatlockia sp.]
MNLFADYIQPLTVWLYDHPNLALLIAFAISFAESLAIIGSIIPGSVTMTALGILAGAGVMRIDLTLLAAALGAIAGDGASYMLGSIYSERLTSIWPFRRYPNWLIYGKDYFTRHGVKSVLIGRFVGPLRSIIPVIAGMMHMSHLRFYTANIISAIAWSFLYVMPGVLIGTASSELSPEIATRLFVIILFSLAGIWLIGLGLKWLFIRANRLLNRNFHNFWIWLIHKPYWGRIAKIITPATESNHYSTAALFLLFTLSIVFFCIIAALVFYSDVCIGLVNQSIHLFFQSLRTGAFDVFFIIVAQLISPLTLITLLVSIAISTMYYKDWRSLAYWISLCLISVLVLVVLQLIIYSPRPAGILKVDSSSSFPIPGLTFITAVGVTLFLYINAYSKTRFKHFITIAIAFCLLLLGLSPLYLGDNWLTDILGAYLCGLSISLGHWLFYRRKKPIQHYHSYLSSMILVLLIFTTSFASILNLKKSIRNHQPYFAQYVFTDKVWWNQINPLLPIYRQNRIGHRISIFNLQYAGSLTRLEEALVSHGWQKQKDSLLNSLLKRVSNPSSSSELPLMSQLYLNKKPALVMSYTPSDGNPKQILRIWRSNYYIEDYKQPIWIGSIYPHKTKLPSGKTATSISYIMSALQDETFLQRRTALPAQISAQELQEQVEPELLLIRESTMDTPD